MRASCSRSILGNHERVVSFDSDVHRGNDLAHSVSPTTSPNPTDFRTISDFRKRHLKALSELFKQVLLLCEKAGLVKLGHVALDGTKVKANASKHKAMSYGRMAERATE